MGCLELAGSFIHVTITKAAHAHLSGIVGKSDTTSTIDPKNITKTVERYEFFRETARVAG
jgi:hypothetical protein